MVYLYHRVEKPGLYPWLDHGDSPAISPEEFEQDIVFLKKQDFRFIRFRDIPNCDFDQNVNYAIICADDGFVSNYTNMLDILGRHSIPATIFQCGGMQSSKPLLWEHQLYWLGCDPILSSEFFSYLERFFPEWPKSFNEIQETMHPKKIESIIAQFMASYPHELKDMHSQARLIYPDETLIKTASSSGVEIGSHGHNHYIGTNISLDEFEKDLVDSCKQLKHTTGQKPASYSYPFDKFNEQLLLFKTTGSK